jgi:ketosteroid isomerase-like protein
MWQGVLDSGIASADLTTTEVHAEGNLAYEVGTYIMNTKDGKMADKGKYVVVWMKEGNDWKLHRDIWNTSMPAAK